MLNLYIKSLANRREVRPNMGPIGSMNVASTNEIPQASAFQPVLFNYGSEFPIFAYGSFLLKPSLS